MNERRMESMTLRQTVETVKKIVREVEVLQKTIDSQSADARQVIVATLIRQKKALARLSKMANDGSAIAGAGYVKACCISGHNVDYIFNYRDNYADQTGVAYVKELFEPERLIPFLVHWNVLNKIQSITSFAWELPNLTDKPFSSVLYDAIQIKNGRAQTFGMQLADKLHQRYNQSIANTDKLEQKGILQTIKLLAKRGYAPVQNLYGAILYKINRPEEAREAYQSVLRNKYALTADIQQARTALRMDKAPIFVRPVRSLDING